MRLFQLALMAKEMEELHDEGLNSISCYGSPEVYLSPRAFNEMFPACWSEDEPFLSNGKVCVRRHIKIDGVKYSAIREVANDP